MISQECMFEEQFQKGLNNGRKCIYNYQCNSRNCDVETKKCKGLSQGESCFNHVQCDNGLACRPKGIWPFDTVCLPLADVGSTCDSDYDCMVRNFCWKLRKDDSQKVCLEQFSAPDGSKMMWDQDKYPEMTKEAIFHHGRFCQSGLARKSADWESECVTIDGHSTDPAANETSGFKDNLMCPITEEL